MITTLSGGWAVPDGAGKRRTSLAFSSSVAMHAGFIALCWLVRLPAVRPGEVARQHYPYRMLQLSTEKLAPRTPRQRPAEAGRLAQGRPGAVSAGAPGAAGGQSPRQEVGPERRAFVLPPPKPVEHTLVQLDVPEIAPRNNLKVPEALIWSHIDAKRPLKQFVAPSPKPLRAELKALPVVPKLEAPNQQTEIANLRMSVDPLAIDPRLTLPNATSTPIHIEAKERGTQIPETVSTAPNQTSAGNLISVPDIALRADGLAMTPPANQIAGMRNPDGVEGGAGMGKGTHPGSGEGEGKGRAGTSSGAGTGTGGTGADARAAGAGAGSNNRASNGASGGGTGSAAATGAGGGTGNAAGPGGQGSNGGKEMVRLVRPANGNHSAVIFGASASEPYPESAGVLSGKIIYTVYLQVGLRKNWILQYCLPKAAGPDLGRGTMTVLAPPWPTLMVRPKDNGAADADYILVHGMITETGRFVQLATVTPEQFESKKQLMDALQQWEFRPASSEGRPSAVEVLLIIPSV